MNRTRMILNARLQPVAGSRFQSTGFPDLGPAIFDRPLADGGNERCLLVESNQSMANRLEAMAWDASEQAPHPVVATLPWVKVIADDGDRYLTSSRTEAHRLASAFVKNATTQEGSTVIELIKRRLGLLDDTPLAPRTIAEEVFRLDPFCLIHGVFFADKQWPGQPKITRALTASIEAHGIQEVVSGGVKRDDVRHSLNDKEEGGTKEGYGSVPFSRVEFTAREIVATFVLDLALLESFGLPEPARDVLQAVALWEVRSLLDGGLRLRTACDLVVVEGQALDLPSLDDLESRIADDLCAVDFGQGEAPLVVRWAKGKR